MKILRSLLIVISTGLLLIVISVSLHDKNRSDRASVDILEAAGNSTGSSVLAATSRCPPCEGLFPSLETSSDGDRVQNTEIQLRGGECTTKKQALRIKFDAEK